MRLNFSVFLFNTLVAVYNSVIKVLKKNSVIQLFLSLDHCSQYLLAMPILYTFPYYRIKVGSIMSES